MGRRIELLDARHERAGFDCGIGALNEFLLCQAGQRQRRGFGKTYVSLDADGTRVTGFVTLGVGQVAAHAMPSNLKVPRYPVPMLRVGYLAVDKRAQGNGLGHDLLAFALHLALEFSARVGLYAVVVDATQEAAAEFYRRLDFEPTRDDGLCAFLPLSRLAKATAP